MANEMRDRLYDLLCESEKKYSAYYEEFIKQLDKAETQADFEKIYDGVIKKFDFFADHLIENGVIVPPCKVGDKVYCLCTLVDDDFCEGCEFYYGGGMGDMPCCDATRHGERKKECIVVCEVVATEKEIYWWLYMNDFGKTVFLTKDQAEQKLKEMRGGKNV